MISKVSNFNSLLNSDNSKVLNDVQKTFILLVIGITFSLKEIEKRFCTVGVTARRLGFLTYILYSALA